MLRLPISIDWFKGQNYLLFLLIGSLIGLFISLSPISTVGILSLIVVIPLMIFLITKPHRLLLLYIIVLPVYQLLMVILFRITNSIPLVKLIQPWKEVLLFSFLVFVSIWYIYKRINIRIQLFDLAAIAYFGLNLLYLVIPFSSSFIQRLLDFRSQTIFVLLYFLGRLIPLSTNKQKYVLNVLVALGIIGGLSVLFEATLLPKDWLMRIHLPQYLSDVQNLPNDPTQIGFLGLPWTYWTSTGIRRYAGFFSNPLDLAVSIHFTGVVALIHVFTEKKKTFWVAVCAFVFSVVALALSISRASIVVFCIEIFLLALFLKKPRVAFLLFSGAILVISIALITNPKISKFVFDTFSFSNPSSVGHLVVWKEGINTIISQPFGLGLGSSGTIGMRFGGAIGGENQYIIIGVELGFLGLFLYLLMNFFGLANSFKLMSIAKGPTRQIAILVFISRIGLLLIGLTAQLEIYLFTTYLSWWLMGFVTQALSKMREGASSDVESRRRRS